MDFENEIKEKLNTKRFERQRGSSSGCISSGYVYECDDNVVVFVKFNEDSISRVMFDGEFYSLSALLSTNTVRVPKPHFVHTDCNSSQSAIVMEYIAHLHSLSSHQRTLGNQLAALHFHNAKLGKQEMKNENWLGKGREQAYVSQFGFDYVTCCGKYPMKNEWMSDWISFFSRFRLEDKINSLLEIHTDRELNELWSQLQLVIPRFFKDLNEKPIIPALLHGDLWAGNAGETNDGPVIYDPSSFYGHSEFDLAIAKMFGGFRREFFDAYHSVIKKDPYFDHRSDLYQLFHYLNHWHHFGTGYRSQSLNLMKKCCKTSI